LYTENVKSTPAPIPSVCILTDGKKSWFVDENGAPLGINSKSHSILVSQRFERYQLQDIAAKLLIPFTPWIPRCHRYWIDPNEKIGIMYNPKREKAHFSNIFTCGSIWGCPVCAAKISESRKVETEKGMNYWKSIGGVVLLLTLTNSHNISHSLASLKKGQKKALKHFFGDRKGQMYFKLLGKQGHINAYEVTHGDSGWHPHHHVLVFLMPSAETVDSSSYASIRNGLAAHWIECCRKARLPLPDMKHGLDLQDGSKAAAYVGKWGLEHEVTKGHIKKGKNGGRTPFDLLRAARDGDEPSGKLFQEFYVCFKGSRQLVHSRGLKALLKIADKTDEEIAAETEKVSEKLFDLDNHFLPILAKLKLRHEFLTAVEDNKARGSPVISGRVEEILIQAALVYYAS
jgi:hypothetical protein